MTIARRVDDAEFLWEAGKREGAFLVALVAFAATGRRIRPRPTFGDRDAFQELFREEFYRGLRVVFRDEPVLVYELFYKWLRCELVHEGGLPVGISLDEDDTEGLITIRGS